MIKTIENGPYVHSIGWTVKPNFSATLASSGNFSDIRCPAEFCDNGTYTLKDQTSISDMFTPLSLALLRSSGIARARSAAKSTVFAALLGKELLGLIKDIPGYDGGQVGVAITSSAITPIAWEFEKVGLERGWLKTDTMLLPSSIPSAIATQVSAALGIHATAIAFQDGAFGFCAAFEQVHLSFIHGRSQYFLLMGAEELCEVQHRALLELNENRPKVDGAAGLLLTKRPKTTSDWQLGLCENMSTKMVLPSPWDDVMPFRLRFPSHLALFSSLFVPYALQQAFSVDSDRIVFICEMPVRGSYVLGFQRK